MSRSYKDNRQGHPQRWKSHGLRYDAVNTPAQHRFIKRSQRRKDRRLNKLDTRCPELIYPYLNMLNPHFVRGSYIVFDFAEEYDWEEDYDWYCDMLDAYWAEEYDDYTGPDDYYPIEIYDDYGDYDYDY